jgi:predicted RND superfamily exporter protein
MITSIPVFIAVLFNFAVMWTLGITLNVGTSIVASVGMGVGIDYAIHYFSRFRILLNHSDSYDTALLHTIVETSRSILSNAAAVALGFLVLIFSQYNAILSVGWITALSMLTTALSSLVVLPAMLSVFKPKVAVVKRRTITPEKAVLEY